MELGGQPKTFKLKSFDILTARAFAPVIRTLEVNGVVISPLVQAVLLGWDY